MTKPIKAVRAQIFLGDIPINAYQMPDGTYRFSGKNVTDALGEGHKSLIRFFGVKSLCDLCQNVQPIKAETGETFFPIPEDIISKFWYARGKAGNQKAEKLFFALNRLTSDCSTTGKAKEQAKESAVYLVACKESGVCKIGISVNVTARICSLQTSSPYPLTLLATMPGGRLEESALHREFGQYRLNGEWFSLRPEILDRFGVGA